MQPRFPGPVDECALERMLEARTPDQLDRALFDLTWGTGLAPALALWRKLDLDAGEPSSWYPMLSRGPSVLLPRNELVHTVLEHGLDERLPGGALVVSSCVARRCVALVIAASANDSASEIASGLLGLHAALEGGLSSEASSSKLPPPLPGTDDSSIRPTPGPGS